jgi:hypothetical protein
LTLIAGQENQMTETGVYQRVCQFDESLAFSQESDCELITINEKTHSIQAISQNGAVREIRHYLFWQPTCIHVAGDIITVGLVDNRMDFEADTVRFGQSIVRISSPHTYGTSLFIFNPDIV